MGYNLSTITNYFY